MMRGRSAIVERLYSAALEPSLWPQALHEFAQAVGAIGTVVIPISSNGPRDILVSPEMREATDAYQRDWWRHDSRVARFQARRLRRGVVSEAELFTDRELARDPFRQEFLRTYGMGAFAAQVLAPLPDFVTSISVQRAFSRGPFEPQELERLAWFGKHAARAVTIGVRLAAARAAEGALAVTLDRLPCGAIVVGAGQRVLLVNAAAERLMGDGLSLSRRRLRAASADRQATLDRLILSAQLNSGLAAPDPVALPRPSGKMPLLLQAIPIPCDTSDAAACIALDPSVVLVMVVDPERDSGKSPAAALRLIGLTPAEARIAALVGTGCSRKEAAETLGISEWTAREALKRVFAKLDISRQSQLIKLVNRLSVLADGWRDIPPNGGSGAA